MRGFNGISVFQPGVHETISDITKWQCKVQGCQCRGFSFTWSAFLWGASSFSSGFVDSKGLQCLGDFVGKNTFRCPEVYRLVGYPQGVARLLSVEQAGHPADSHRCSAVFTARCGAVLSVSISPCGNYCITGYANCTARVWSVERGSCVKALCRHSGSVLAVSLSSDAETAVTGSSDELAKIWSVRTGSCSQVLRGHMGIVTSVSFAAEDQRVVTGSFDGSVKVWHCASGVCEMTLSTLSGSAPILSLAVCPVEDLVLTGSLDGRCRLWELSTGSMSQVFEAGEAVRSVAISRDGCHILCGDADGSCRFWNLKTRKSKQVYLQRGEPILSVMLHSLD